MIRIGVIGCGAVVHQMYAKTLIGRHDYAARYVYDTNPDQAASAAVALGASVVPQAELIDKADAIIVTTPPASHAAIVRECLSRDRVVLCEKPFVTSRDEAVALTAEARAAGARLYVSQFRRTFPQLELARQLVSLGLLGDVISFSASEGGRFTWRSVSGYTTTNRTGGVLWDTGAHTLDMALFAAGLDDAAVETLHVGRGERDKDEPSHDLRAEFELEQAGRSISAHVHVSRLEALPNLVRIRGTAGELAFSVAMDDRVRLTTDRGSMVIVSERSQKDLLECFDLQLRSIFLSRGDAKFAAENFVGQIGLIEVLADAD